MPSDEEIICKAMEPTPVFGLRSDVSSGGWWIRGIDGGIKASPLDSLDTLHRVETILTDEQWPRYRSLIQESAWGCDTRWSRILVHATAKQKLKALAEVLRGS